ncbi:CsbD family protein [Leptolyngbya iicbica]|uniref:CsbD family protein n=2 Tax=Cyanophyceae TaxID=3028117 RepID=A0A4Q7E6B8_9CYAN|nr:hypothetical protein [Leptolyngbya sp. LK]RZM78660.1 hypothetical protein DYY88_07600 [Leptolyngbya sp. LK]
MQLIFSYERIKKVLIVCTLAIAASCSLLLGWGTPAYAGTDAADVIQDRAEQEFDRMAGEGSVNQIKGKAREDLGRVQRQFGDDIEGAAQQAKGKAQKDIGRTQAAADQAADAAQERAENVVDKVKDFFD